MALPTFEPSAIGAGSPQRRLEGHGRIAGCSFRPRLRRAEERLAILLMAIAPSRKP